MTDTSTPTLTFIVIVAIVSFLVGISKGGLGSALGSLATPLMTLVLPAPVALGTALIFLLVGDVFAIWAHWRKWNRQIVFSTMPGTIVGVIVASILLDRLPALTIQHAIGLLSLFYCAWKIFEWRIRKGISALKAEQLPKWSYWVLGTTTGFASTVGNAGAPIYTAYLLLLHLQPETFAASAALYFALTNVMKIPGYIAAHIFHPEVIVQFFWAIPIIYLGIRVGKVIDHYLDIKTFEKVIIILLVITAAYLLLKA